jgi:hypothetical protein
MVVNRNDRCDISDTVSDISYGELVDVIGALICQPHEWALSPPHTHMGLRTP